MGNASQINRSQNSVRVERRSDLNKSDLGEVYCMSQGSAFGRRMSADTMFFGLPTGAVPSTTYLTHAFAQSTSQFRSICPCHLSLDLLITLFYFENRLIVNPIVLVGPLSSDPRVFWHNNRSVLYVCIWGRYFLKSRLINIFSTYSMHCIIRTCRSI